jgi:hypothetical protein
MAKKAARSTADDTAAQQGAKGARRGMKLSSAPDRPENISETLIGREGSADQAERVQQAPGDAVAARPLGEPSDEEIRARAYEMYLERGGKHGLDFDDWVRAERELRLRR